MEGGPTTEPEQPLPPAGWYADPSSPETLQRYWDGQRWTDSYAPVDTPIVDPADPPRDLTPFARLAIGGLVVIAALAAFNIVADARYVSLLDEQIAGDQPPADELGDAADLVDASSIAFGLGYSLLGPLVFLPWFYRAYVNLRRFGIRNLRYSAGWAIGAWFIPVFNLFRPKQIANDLYRGTAGGKLHGAGKIDSHPVGPLLHWWWAMFILMIVVGVIAGAYLSEDDPFASGSAAFDSVEDARSFYIGDLIASGVGIVAIALAIGVVRRITADQKAVGSGATASLHTWVAPPESGDLPSG